MTATTTEEQLGRLAARLTEPHDRESYASLISFVNSLPPSDEFRRLAELMGLLSLLSQRVPDALADAMTELRELAMSAQDYRDQVDARLAALPVEITSGVNVAAVAEAAGELFRQAIVTTGLQGAAALLRDSSGEITALSNEISATLKPASQQYKTIAGTISTELGKLAAASTQLQQHNAYQVRQERSNDWLWQTTAALVLVLFGVLCGILIEKRRTADTLVNIESQIERIQTPVAVVLPVKTRRKGKE